MKTPRTPPRTSAMIRISPTAYRGRGRPIRVMAGSESEDTMSPEEMGTRAAGG